MNTGKINYDIFKGQTNFVKLMQLMGYKNADTEGVCFGISCMAMQASLCAELEIFDKRIEDLVYVADTIMGGAHELKWFKVNDLGPYSATEGIQKRFDA